jgi:hypothetical protein
LFPTKSFFFSSPTKLPPLFPIFKHGALSVSLADEAYAHDEDHHGHQAVHDRQDREVADEEVELVGADLEEVREELLHLPAGVAVWKWK